MNLQNCVFCYASRHVLRHHLMGDQNHHPNTLNRAERESMTQTKIVAFDVVVRCPCVVQLYSTDHLGITNPINNVLIDS